MSTGAAVTASGSGTQAGPHSAIPRERESFWHIGPEGELPARLLGRIGALTESLASTVPFVDRSELFGPLVGAADLRSEPIHRWYTYKEAFSPVLPAAVLALLPELGRELVVADVFGGVATTALALRDHPRVAEIRSVEYSPFAQFVGSTKLSSSELNAGRLRAYVPALLDYRVRHDITPPDLAAFRNARIFHPATRASLLSARERIDTLPGLSQAERSFFRLGLAAIVEDSSGAMKDGRALRICGARKRTPNSLGGRALASVPISRGRVKGLLSAQWSAMLEDLRSPGQRGKKSRADTIHVRGDARKLARVRQPDGQPVFRAGTNDLFVFSPPYLNCIDYTEVYKLELWLLEHVKDQAGFKGIRRGSLRSHPSVRFAEVNAFCELDSPVVDLVADLSGWVTTYGSRREVGAVVRQYFEDMFSVYQQQFRALRSGGVSVCVVANSTFSRRRRTGEDRFEEWRLPILTDVLLAHLATGAGFESVELWSARDLRPRNVHAGRARESLVVARKP